MLPFGGGGGGCCFRIGKSTVAVVVVEILAGRFVHPILTVVVTRTTHCGCGCCCSDSGIVVVVLMIMMMLSYPRSSIQFHWSGMKFGHVRGPCRCGIVG